MNFRASLCLILICFTLQDILADDDDLLSPEQARKLDPETGIFKIHNDEVIKDKYKIEVEGHNGVRVGCYGHQNQGVWIPTSYVTDQTGYRTFNNLDKQITVVPNSGQAFTIVFNEILPKCGSFYELFIKESGNNLVHQPSITQTLRVRPPNTIEYEPSTPKPRVNKSPNESTERVEITDTHPHVTSPPFEVTRPRVPYARPTPPSTRKPSDNLVVSESNPPPNYQTPSPPTTPRAYPLKSTPSGSTLKENIPSYTPTTPISKYTPSERIIIEPPTGRPSGYPPRSTPPGPKLIEITPSPRPPYVTGPPIPPIRPPPYVFPPTEIVTPTTPIRTVTPGPPIRILNPTPRYVTNVAPVIELTATGSSPRPKYEPSPAPSPSTHIQPQPKVTETQCIPDAPKSIEFESPFSIHGDQDEPFRLSLENCKCTCPNTKNIPRSILKGQDYQLV